MLDRWVEDGLLDVLNKEGIGCIVFSPLAQGQLTDRYLNGIPSGARATKTERVWLTSGQCKEEPAQDLKTERACEETRTIAGADGARLGASQTRGDIGFDRREQCQAVGR